VSGPPRRRSGNKPPRASLRKGGNRSRSAQRQPKEVVYRPTDNAVAVGIEAGIDLAHFLAEQLPGQWSVRAVRRFLAEGRVTVNGQVETFGSRRLRRGEVVDFRLPDEATGVTRFEPKRLLLDDFGMVAYDKPPGLAVTPTDSGKQWHLQKLLGDELGQVLPVHRLDADTSGVVCFARSKGMAATMEGWFKDHQVSKVYHAIVRGHPPEEGVRRSYLVPIERQPGFEKWGTGRGSEAREAVTRWQVVDRLGSYASLLRVEPATGRHHQIRVHFSEMGHPLYGDRLYGDRRDPVLTRRQMLHASELRCPPVDGQERGLRITCPLPKDFRDLQKELLKLRA
jgi:23S rRNA pseudouridine955/2504/2580 synthase/23S rRNA pseudouridine1911/1915/1917 synthase